jgi:hypothetical protein
MSLLARTQTIGKVVTTRAGILQRVATIDANKGYGVTCSSLLTTNGSAFVLARYLVQQYAAIPQMRRELGDDSFEVNVEIAGQWLNFETATEQGVAALLHAAFDSVYPKGA